MTNKAPLPPFRQFPERRAIARPCGSREKFVENSVFAAVHGAAPFLYALMIRSFATEIRFTAGRICWSQ